MEKKIALTLALAALLSTQSQARIAIKKYKGDAVIVRQSNGKYSLIGTNHKPIITNAETISKRDLGYFIVKKTGKKEHATTPNNYFPSNSATFPLLITAFASSPRTTNWACTPTRASKSWHQSTKESNQQTSILKTESATLS